AMKSLYGFETSGYRSKFGQHCLYNPNNQVASGAKMDRFSAMEAFARVVETGSFTKAAETLQMSRASVTQLVQQLEARLRVRLLHRTPRKVNVPADGAVYYERVVKLLADFDDAETSLSSAFVSPRGRLR